VSLSGKVKAEWRNLNMRPRLGILLGMAGMLAACVVAFPPVEVTRFHLSPAVAPGKVRIDSGVVPSAEALNYAAAVSAAMAKQGFSIATPGEPSDYSAAITFSSSTTRIMLSVLLNDAKANTVWDGRAQTTARTNSPAIQPGLAAQKLADALFSGFPGDSGKTITVP
jgi:hypothetical protein